MLVNGRPDFERNNLTIVTFNYDRSLEAYIHTALQARFGITQSEAADILSRVPIIHVHGILGNYPSQPYQPTVENDQFHLNSNIQIVHEFDDRDGEFANPMFERASNSMRNSERVAFMGFGWHEDNVRRLKYFGHCDTSRKEIHATTPDYSPFQRLQLMARLKEMSCDNMKLANYNCNDFFRYEMELH